MKYISLRETSGLSRLSPSIEDGDTTITTAAAVRRLRLSSESSQSLLPLSALDTSTAVSQPATPPPFNCDSKEEISNMTSDSEDKMSEDCMDSPSVEEASSIGKLGGGGLLKKGPWTSAEDAILVDYVNRHGEGNWNAVQKHSGLSRCGKSCRLRWANHLRPDLRKGAFTPKEERQIIELHAKMGNKWARMAAEMPGRTDNEIKNYWNTRIKRRHRAGLPIYPPDISQALHENQQCQNVALPDIPASGLLAQGLGSSHSDSLMFSMLHPPKRFRESRESECLIPCVNSSTADYFPAFDQYPDDGCEKITQLSSSILPGSHALLNGNFSSSEPMPWAMNPELPSLQYSDAQVGSWGTGTPSSPLPSLDSVSTLIQSPLTEQAQSDSLSRRNSGLLEAVLYESHTLKSSKNSSCDLTSNVSVVAGDAMDSLSQNLRETQWEIHSDPISPLGHSTSSVFSECTPISGSSFDEPHSVEIFPECLAKQEAVDWVTTKCDVNEENANQMMFLRPDFLLASNWFGHSTERGREHSVLNDTRGTLLGEDFNGDCKQISTMSVSDSSCQKRGCGSCSWDDMSTACELSENL
ncbi:hypothetical protein HYC85_031103 [Camellia sinensis]|uniref:Transcription factor GAMYB n=1 Tax=Camellia sinensis TaxID=4442 RepID=A0A7J7FPS9_CAMSI|nr:hypothetical protein HYC85_031103 [Camellia sinensis]